MNEFGGIAMDWTNHGNLGSEPPRMFVVRRPPAAKNCAWSSPRNRLLAALPDEVLSSLQPHLEPVALTRGKVLCEADDPLTRVYFVEAGTVSLVTVFADGTTAEMATVGREGLVGIGALLGGESNLGCYIAPTHGLALAVEISRFRSLLRESLPLQAACAAYAQAFLGEALQTAACNSVHMVQERCARWILTCADRSDGGALTLTQEYLARVLGVCRSTVTLAAGALQRAGLIRYRRGVIAVLDRAGLESVSCECYRVIRNHYARLPPYTYGQQAPRLDEQSRSLTVA